MSESGSWLMIAEGSLNKLEEMMFEKFSSWPLPASEAHQQRVCVIQYSAIGRKVVV
jgi:hypothetical protein